MQIDIYSSLKLLKIDDIIKSTDVVFISKCILLWKSIPLFFVFFLKSLEC